MILSDQDVILIEAGAEAIEPVMAIMETAFEPRFGEAWNQAQCLGIMSLPGVWLALARAGERVVGFALCRVVIDEAELLLLAVLPEARRRGIGGFLLEGFQSGATMRGAAHVHLEVREGNEAQRLYLSNGFEIIGRRTGYYKSHFGHLYDALTLKKSLIFEDNKKT